jgi:hypothetical protein
VISIYVIFLSAWFHQFYGICYTLPIMETNQHDIYHLREGLVKQKGEHRNIDQGFEHIGMGLSPCLWS